VPLDRIAEAVLRLAASVNEAPDTVPKLGAA
jgi:hypothetical protein